jgi:glucosamine 6-phosphate synthetase-like amidotransferase/phosphosugar isomerase protein
MKNTTRISVLFVLSLFYFQCSGHKHEEREITQELEEANAIHQKSLDIREELMELEKALKEAEIEYTEVKDLLKIWDKDIIEVPGFEHSHDHDDEGGNHRNYHVHNPMKPFSDVEHLEYQKVMHDEILEIQDRVRILLAPKVMDEDATDAV